VSTALVHIGTHRTGTTAFQQWTERHRAALLELRDIRMYEGRYLASHFELALLCIRRNRTMRQQRRVPEWCLDEWREETIEHVARQVDHPAQGLLISAEALSLLRYEDEVAALRDLLSPRRLQVAVCLREKQSFLDSYRREMWIKDIAPSHYRTSHDYIRADTWLVKWEEMLSVWRSVLGDENVVDFSYEEAMAQYRSTIPAVLGALWIDPIGLPSWEGVTANTSPRPIPGGQRLPLALKRLTVEVKRRISSPQSSAD
jgi:hypothetical protein